MITSRSRLFPASCLLVLVLASPSAGQQLPAAKPEEVGVSSQKVEELATFMKSLVDDGKIPGGVTIMARHGKVVHLKAVGMSDKKAKSPMQTDAIFRIASMTKPITSVAIMMLYEQGKLGLDDPVAKYIPAFKNPKVLVSTNPLKTEPAKGEITIRQLLTHTSGLGYTFTDKLGRIYDRHGISAGLCITPTSLDQAMDNLARMPLLFNPGERWEYGMSTDVLGRVVEVASGCPLDRFIEQEICRPLGMNDTFFQVPAQKLPRLASAYVPVETCLRKVKAGEVLRHEVGAGIAVLSSDYSYAASNRYRSGGAGLCSTASDYLRFCQMILNGGTFGGVRLLREDTVRLMTTNQVGKSPQPFGFGFGVMPDDDKLHKQLRASYNWAGFWSTSFRISPRGDWIVVTMTQVAWDDQSNRSRHPLLKWYCAPG
jgi:CubicO group peptidase (beta-lactamase class C family)